MLKQLRTTASRIYINSRLPWLGPKRIVIESDDWGAEAIPDQATFQKLLAKGFAVDEDPYCRLDNIATAEDLEALFHTLLTYKDERGNPPVITANTNMGNPDYARIRESGFENYHYLSLAATLDKHAQRTALLPLWKKGIEENVFHPQLHGREHLNVLPWLRALKEDLSLRAAFDLGVYSMLTQQKVVNRCDFKAAFDYAGAAELTFHVNAIKQSFTDFTTTFGFTPRTFIATCYVWSTFHEEVLKELGVLGLQGGLGQKIPRGSMAPYQLKRNRLGDKNDLGQTYLVRNVFFEPALSSEGIDELVNRCLWEIGWAFRLGKPAIISAHRLNFIGSRSVTNRDRTLRALNQLLKSILTRWGDVEFITSDQLLVSVSNSNTNI